MQQREHLLAIHISAQINRVGSQISMTGGYTIVWHRPNHYIRIPPWQLHKNGKFDLAITLLNTLSADLSKLGIAPTRLGLFRTERTAVLTSLRAVELRCTVKIDKFHQCWLSCLLIWNIQAWYISITYIP